VCVRVLSFPLCDSGFDYVPGKKHGRSLLWAALTQPHLLPSNFMQLVLRYSAADLCTTNDQGESCLVVAAQNGNTGFVDAVHELLQEKTDEQKGELALQGAGQLPLREQVRAMVQMKNARGQTTLIAAIRPFSFASCANVPMVRERTLSPLPYQPTRPRLALMSTGNVKQVSKLVELGVDVNEAELETGNTALFYAATTNSIPLCEYVLSSMIVFRLLHVVCCALCGASRSR